VNQNLHLNVRLKCNDDIDTAVNYLTNVIQTAAWSANTPKKHVHNNNTNLLSTNIRILIAEKRRARAIYQRTRLPSHKKIYNKLANTLKKVLSKVKNRSFENFLTNLSTNNDSLWKATKLALHYKVTIPPIKDLMKATLRQTLRKPNYLKTTFLMFSNLIKKFHLLTQMRYL